MRITTIAFVIPTTAGVPDAYASTTIRTTAVPLYRRRCQKN
jgi:hypothetical protein